MTPSIGAPRPAEQRDLILFRNPKLWPTWPLLPIVRRKVDGEVECGVLYDLVGTGGPCGYSAAVFLTNLFTLPRTLDHFLALPKEVFDTAEEIAAAGWVVD
jgi:hypothetical protein